MNLDYEANKELIDEKTEELLRQADAVIEPKEPVYKVMPQGQLVSMIVRNREQGLKVPDPFKPMVLMPDGEPRPYWQQIAGIMTRPNKKLAIVGFADTKMEAPFDDLTYEIWGLNDLHASLPRYDRWFDIHPVDNIQQDYKLLRNQGQTPPENIGIQGLSKLNVPVYMNEDCPDVPNRIIFPLKEMLEVFEKRGLVGARYLTNSISVMIAYAIFEGIITNNPYKEIAVYGVDMAVGTEYVDQRPSCEYWLGIAEGMGIKVVIPNASDLLKTRFMYAFEQKKQDAFRDKLDNMAKNMEERHRMICQQEQQARDARNQYEGAIGCRKEIYKIWSNLDDKL